MVGESKIFFSGLDISFLLDNSGLHWKIVRMLVNYTKTIVKVASILSHCIVLPNLAGMKDKEQNRGGESWTDIRSTK